MVTRQRTGLEESHPRCCPTTIYTDATERMRTHHCWRRDCRDRQPTRRTGRRTRRPVIGTDSHQDPQLECFLCEPESEWVWAESEHFFVMCALGPVVPGTSLLASREHVPSMFDVDDSQVPELEELSRRAAMRLGEVYGQPVHLTEHGRIGLCEIDAGHDQHCYHAHRLMFPIDFDIAAQMTMSVINPIRATSFSVARIAGGHLTKYLYHEAPDGAVTLGAEDDDAPRQYFRGIVADAIGAPELRSWRQHPQTTLVIEAARGLR